jgi:hypothetical protein
MVLGCHKRQINQLKFKVRARFINFKFFVQNWNNTIFTCRIPRAIRDKQENRMNNKSMEGLIEFLDWTAEKGLMTKNTVNGRKAAVSGVLGVLAPEEKGDVTVLDLDTVMSRFINLQGKKYNPSSLNVYKSRIKTAINDFRGYLNDPLAFKGSGGKVEKKPSNNSAKLKKQSETLGNSESSHNTSPPSMAYQASANVFPIQIRENVVVRIHGLPFDLTQSEAERIANVVKAMAAIAP